MVMMARAVDKSDSVDNWGAAKKIDGNFDGNLKSRKAGGRVP
jgi:hypothetical protein